MVLFHPNDTNLSCTRPTSLGPLFSCHHTDPIKQTMVRIAKVAPPVPPLSLPLNSSPTATTQPPTSLQPSTLCRFCHHLPHLCPQRRPGPLNLAPSLTRALRASANPAPLSSPRTSTLSTAIEEHVTYLRPHLLSDRPQHPRQLTNLSFLPFHLAPQPGPILPHHSPNTTHRSTPFLRAPEHYTIPDNRLNWT